MNRAGRGCRFIRIVREGVVRMATLAARPRGAFTAELAGRPAPSEEERQRQASWQAELRAQAEEQRRARDAEKQREKERDRLVCHFKLPCLVFVRCVSCCAAALKSVAVAATAAG